MQIDAHERPPSLGLIASTTGSLKLEAFDSNKLFVSPGENGLESNT